MTPHRLSCRVYRPESLPRLVLVLAASIAVFLLFNISLVLAQTEGSEEPQSCGDIITPADFYWEGEDEYRSSYYDCMNPFNTTEIIEGFFINNQAVTDGAVLVVPETGIQYYGFQGDSYRELANSALYYKQVDTDFIQQSVDFLLPTRDEIEASIARYFAGNPVLIARYTEIYFAPDQSIYFQDENYDFLIDPYTGNRTLDEYTALDQFIYSNYSWPREPLLPGRYTIVIQEFGDGGPVLGKQQSWREKIYSYVIPTVYAQEVVGAKTLTFTLVTEVPEPEGASSILFLPGIMGSHLYEMGQQCGDFGDEQQRWFSTDKCEQLRLLLNESGDSQHDVYTKVGEEGIFAAVDLGAIEFASNYAGFIEAMEDLEGETIHEFVPFPYDWRLRLDHLLQLQANDEGEVRYVPDLPYTEGLLYTTINEMARDSYSKKVTIVAHSNGGLVAKAFLEKLEAENDLLASKIDNLILVGSPQVGTPDAVVGLLHGTDLAGGWVVEAEVSRQILNDAPMTYHLLPNEHYFRGDGVSVDTPVILFDSGTATDPYIAQFGSEIENVSDFKRFAGGVSGRATPDVADLYTPAVANDTLLSYADGIGDTLAGWTPPETINVHQLAGIGMWTPKTLRYFSGEECINRGFLGFGCDAYAPKLLHETYFTREGDGTVVLPSALAMGEESNVTRWWLNLEQYNAVNRSKNIHKDMMEIPDVATFVATIAGGFDLSPSTYIRSEAPDLTDEHTLVYRLHSPLDMYIESDDGIVSSTTNTIPGALYRRQGETQYIFIPPDTKGAVLHLVGYAAGSFTLVVETLAGEEVIKSTDYRAVPTGLSTRATLVVDGVDEIQVDFDGDGNVDGTVDAATDIPERMVVPPPAVATSTVVTLPDSRTSGGTRVRDVGPVGQVAGATIDEELARLAEMVRLLEEVVRLMVIIKQM